MKSCRALAVVALTGLTVACGEPAERASSSLTTPLREALLTTPLQCTPEGPRLEDVMRTEYSDIAVCPGFMHWDVLSGLELDVVRYGTILELNVDAIERGPTLDEFPHSAPPSTWKSIDRLVNRVRGEVTAVLKGSAPTGDVVFPIVAWQPPPRLKAYYLQGQGGWEMPHVARKRFSRDPILEPLRGLVFLPTDGIVDGIFVGCAEGHFVPTNGEEGEAYVRDVRQIAKHRRATHERDLATQPKESSMVRELAAGGGVLMGQYLAEYCDHEVATALLEDPTSSEIPPLQRGLFHGLLRMRMLLIPKIYHPWWWHGAFARQLEVRLGRWAALAWVSGATLDPVTLNLIQYSIARAMFGEAAEIGMLGLDRAVQARLAERLDAMDSTHVLSAPEARAWARGERFEATERYAAPRMLMASHTDCKDFQWRSASYELYRLVLAGHFGAY